MGKRSFEEAEGADVNGYEGQKQNQNQNQHHQHKPRNPHNRFNPKSIAKRQKTTQKINDGNLSQIKKRVRAIERLLQHKNEKLPANVRNDLERELQAHKQRMYDESDKRLRSKMISKYHMVRFFERKKAERLAKQLKKQLDETKDEAEVARLKADLHIAEVDLDYALYHPHMETYISLYPKSKDEATEKDEKSSAAHHLHSSRPPMWTTIEKARKEGKKALEKIRDRRPERHLSLSKPASKKTAKTDSSQNEERPAKGKYGKTEEKKEESESEDGGFFEED
ncbi:hypothetical protein QBC32DRAFT_63177 [Pseudoneurospora amorphoporcata]|uniref:rRNA-processing protein EFG1 n=1 Tax=Pseudoneurospora amorphoporcata TaxID=241081 RepID=A0AAN6SC66_9PEZI|nr:hypothetical protein QBC32DRAFT_63177 [Pseudoneurospora amorphoporcata]